MQTTNLYYSKVRFKDSIATNYVKIDVSIKSVKQNVNDEYISVERELSLCNLLQYCCSKSMLRPCTPRARVHYYSMHVRIGRL